MIGARDLCLCVAGGDPARVQLGRTPPPPRSPDILRLFCFLFSPFLLFDSQIYLSRLSHSATLLALHAPSHSSVSTHSRFLHTSGDFNA